MIQIGTSQNILLAYSPIDFRKGIDSLIAVCKHQLKTDPFEGAVFVFRNKRGTALKILAFDGFGIWLAIRRFSQGSIRWWPSALDNTPIHKLQAHQLSILIFNGTPEQAQFISPWKPVHTATSLASAFTDSS